MTQSGDQRPGETAVALPEATDAGIYFIGRVRTPFSRREDCPKNARGSDALCRLEIDPLWVPALEGLDGFSHVVVLYWMDRARRDLVSQSPRHLGHARGTFALRSPARPNPIAMSVVPLVEIVGSTVFVRGLDCIDATPLVDLKPYFPRVDAVSDAKTP